MSWLDPSSRANLGTIQGIPRVMPWPTGVEIDYILPDLPPSETFDEVYHRHIADLRQPYMALSRRMDDYVDMAHPRRDPIANGCA